MSTDPSPDASAYLDGASTPAERAAVEADPVALGEVERFRALRDELRAVDGTGGISDGTVVEAQERAIFAALAAFDELHAAPAAAVAVEPSRVPSGERRDGSVVPIPSRRGLPSWLGAAAAVVLVVAAGAFVVSRGGGQDSDEASTEPATLAVTDEAGGEGADGAGDAETRSADAAVASEEAAPMVAAGDAPADAPSEDATSGGATAESDVVGTEAPAAIDTPEVASTLVATPESENGGVPVELVGTLALTTYVEETVARWRDTATWPPAVEDDRCLDAPAAPDDAIPLGEVRYAASDAEAPSPAVLLTDPSTTQVVALDPVDCRVLAETDLEVSAP